MPLHSDIGNDGSVDSSLSGSPLDRFLNVLRRTLLVSSLIGLVWLPGLFINPALALSTEALSAKNASQLVDSTADVDSITALIACLPKQLSQPNLKRALSEMGNDQLERAFNLKSTPKLSQAEIELATCLNH
jgi:hypothetical protein